MVRTYYYCQLRQFSSCISPISDLLPEKVIFLYCISGCTSCISIYFQVVFLSMSKWYFHLFPSCISIYVQVVFPSISKLYFSDFQSLCLGLDWHSNPGSERKSQGWTLTLQSQTNIPPQKSQTSQNSFTFPRQNVKIYKIFLLKYRSPKGGPSASSPRLTFPSKIQKSQTSQNSFTFPRQNVKIIQNSPFEIQKSQGWSLRLQPQTNIPFKNLRCQTFSSKNVKIVNNEIDPFEIQKYQRWPLVTDQFQSDLFLIFINFATIGAVPGDFWFSKPP